MSGRAQSDDGTMQTMVRRLTAAQFIARSEQVALLDGVLDRVTRTRGGDVLLVGGEAGVGKSRLVTEFLERARQENWLTLIGRCVENGELVMPLAPIADLLRDLAKQTPGAELA